MGVKKLIKIQGDGKTYPKTGQLVTVHYVGKLRNGNKFDSSVDRNQPFSFNIGMGKVIKGWDIGVASMSLGEVASLVISPEYGYGAKGAGRDIPPNSELIFEVRLLKC